MAVLALSPLPARPDAEAQPASKVPRIGVLQPGAAGSAGHLFEAFKEGLREQGYVPGQTIVLEHRFGEFNSERISALAAELVRLKVDVIVTSTD